MSDVVIRVEGLGKKYVIGHESRREPYRALRDEIADGAKKFLRKTRDLFQGRPIIEGDELEEVWALRDVGFEVRRGDVLGVIGRNGAGKSTLLKILSRITEPSEGRVSIDGRVASLLEVGTGFHLELTGRENVFLNGAILGMARSEIRRKLDEIVAFAEIEKYLDTPVKRYSSGMYLRLAFSVAAHLEPEILVIDEVLAVGDAEFQKRCLGKIGDVARGGRTILFVSHNMQAISVLCQNAVSLANGRLADQGPARQVVQRYLATGAHRLAEAAWSAEDAPSGDSLRMRSVKVCAVNGQVSYDQYCGAPVTLSMEFWCLRSMKLLPIFHLYNQDGIFVFPTSPMHVGELDQKVYEPGLFRCSCVIPGALLNTGSYSVHAFLSRETDGLPYIRVRDAVSFRVINDGTGMGGAWTGMDDWPGVIRPMLAWSGERLGALPGDLPVR